MKFFLQAIVLIVLLAGSVISGMYFDHLWQKEEIQHAELYIYPSEKNFIVPEEVKKIIKIDGDKINNVQVDSLEKILETNEYIQNAEVYRNLNGKLVAEIEQYKPIARIVGRKSYYIDIDGNEKPLSSHYTERVVLVFGNLSRERKPEIKKLLQKIYKDKILNEIISEIHLKEKDIYLKINGLKSVVRMKTNEKIEQQLYKLKIINAYLIKKHLENKYKEIDLRYENQVVCKKK